MIEPYLTIFKIGLSLFAIALMIGVVADSYWLQRRVKYTVAISAAICAVSAIWGLV